MEEPGRREMVSNFIFIGTRKVGGRKNPMVIWAFDVKDTSKCFNFGDLRWRINLGCRAM